MTRKELIDALYAKFPQLTQQDVEIAVKSILSRMESQLTEDGRIEIRGFGSFSIHTRPARMGRNPKTGEKVLVPQKAAPHFKAGIELRKRVNGS